jgi:hypothetical protein
MIGSTVYEDERIAIYAPWGAPVPCDSLAIGPDTLPGGEEAIFNTLLLVPPDQTIIRPLFGDSAPPP